jgi:Domain of unknown function (DUF5919)
MTLCCHPFRTSCPDHQRWSRHVAAPSLSPLERGRLIGVSWASRFSASLAGARCLGTGREQRMTGQPTLLAVLLEDKGLHRYGTFRAAYEKAARSLDRHLDGSAPSRAQFHRWLTGDLRRLPYTDHCRVLEQMLTGYSAGQLFQPTPDGGTPAPARGAPGSGQELTRAAGMADVAAVFASRSDFAARVEPRALFDGASRIRAAGLSLNLICQQVPDQHLRRMLADGAQLTCLFLDPDGEAIKAREQEEEYAPGILANLTSLNVQLDVLLPACPAHAVRSAISPNRSGNTTTSVNARPCLHLRSW